MSGMDNHHLWGPICDEIGVSTATVVRLLINGHFNEARRQIESDEPNIRRETDKLKTAKYVMARSGSDTIPAGSLFRVEEENDCGPGFYARAVRLPKGHKLTEEQASGLRSISLRYYNDAFFPDVDQPWVIFEDCVDAWEG